MKNLQISRLYFGTGYQKFAHATSQVFIDLYRFYPKFNLKFEEIEFIYLDFGSQTPKVLASLLSELLVRDAPLQEAFVHDFIGYAGSEAAFPPPERTRYSEKQLHNAMIDYFVTGERHPVFVEIINLYLKARPQILAECTKDLLDYGNVVNDDSLAQYFLGYYIFKGVSIEALGFCAANADSRLDPFKKRREAAWEKQRLEAEAYIAASPDGRNNPL